MCVRAHTQKSLFIKQKSLLHNEKAENLFIWATWKETCDAHEHVATHCNTVDVSFVSNEPYEKRLVMPMSPLQHTATQLMSLSFPMSRMKGDLWCPSRMSFCIPMTISSLIFSGTGCSICTMANLATNINLPHLRRFAIVDMPYWASAIAIVNIVDLAGATAICEWDSRVQWRYQAHWRVLQCVAVCCSVLQCGPIVLISLKETCNGKAFGVAVCCSVLQRAHLAERDLQW